MAVPSLDVLVAGGGVAGITAAIAAARAGAQTLLVERAGWLGGLGVTGATGLHSFFNIYGAAPGAPRLKLVGGIPQLLVDRVQAMGGGVGHVEMERGGDFVSMLTPVEPETFKAAAARMCLESGVNLLLHTVLTDVRAQDGRVSSVRVWNKGGFSDIEAKLFVDCTGDGDLAALAGAQFVHFQPGDPGAYSAGFTFRMCNVDLNALVAYLDDCGMIRQLAHAVKPGTDKPDIVRLGINMARLREAGAKNAPGYFLSSSLRPRELTYCNCINHGPIDALSAQQLTESEVDLRSRMLDVVQVFRDHLPGCAQVYPAGAAPAVGPRRARAIRCDYELTQDDVTSGRNFPDQIGRFGFIDNPKYFVKDAGAYGIPYRALRPVGLHNVLIAGRMMTVDLVAHNSTRNTVCCMICGQTAGTAAAIAARKGISTRDVNVEELQTRLLDAGVILEPKPWP